MKPLLLVDCDNVLLEFVRPLQSWLLDRHDIDFRIESYALLSNMRHRGDGRTVSKAEFPALLEGFFADGQPLQQALPGAVEALQQLARDMDVIVLTNIPEQWRHLRLQHLRGLGIDAPVVANAGPKGPMVKELAGDRPTVFVDDLPPQLESAADHAPAVGRLHMVGEDPLRNLVPTATAAHTRIDIWPDAELWIRQWLTREI